MITKVAEVKEIEHYTVVENLLRKNFKEPISMIEIGVNEAAMEKHLLSKFNDISIIGVDITLNPIAMQFAIASKGRFTYLNTSSEFALKSFFLANMKFDFIYIDGAHGATDVKKDISNSMLLTRKGGIIGGHDYTESYWDVKRVVDEMFGDIVKTGPNLTWWIHV